ncbi:MAG TPA: hypothetical protein PLI53_08310 [Geobacteraceae bacterium]|nr:hypothetical protein [Geobacteraceae bacterium]
MFFQNIYFIVAGFGCDEKTLQILRSPDAGDVFMKEQRHVDSGIWLGESVECLSLLIPEYGVYYVEISRLHPALCFAPVCSGKFHTDTGFLFPKSPLVNGNALQRSLLILENIRWVIVVHDDTD